MMMGWIKRRAALLLSAVLLLSQCLGTTLYAAELNNGTENTTETVPKDANEYSKVNMTDFGTEPATENSTEVLPENETVTEFETEPETITEPKSEAASESETEPESKTESESTIETETEPETESQTESQTEIITETLPEPKSETVPKEEPEYPCPAALEPENIPHDENQDAFTDRLVNGKRLRSTLPASYDARTQGYLPAVRNQGSWGACWSFSLTGAMEVSAVKDMGITPETIDLSEHHLAYFGYNTGYDALDNANGDTMTCSPASYYLTNGGNDIRGVVRLMNWNGGAGEQDYLYPAGSLPAAPKREAAQDAKIYLENAYRYNFAGEENKAEAINVVKKMIADYGAVSWSYYQDAKYANEATGAYYNNVGGSGTAKTNHAIMAVGWDDSYSRENFRSDNQPENDGAWIIRNSWGINSGDNGYYYMSYEDKSLGSGNPVYAVTVCDSAKYDNNYFYGNTAYSSATIAVRRAAQVYKIKSEAAVREKLTAVSFLIGTSDVDYELQIYKNPDEVNGIVENPTSGTPMLDEPQKGKTNYAGFHTIALDTPVTLDADDSVSVVLTFPNTRPAMYFDRSYTSDNGQQKGEHILQKGQSFYSDGLTSWLDNAAKNRTFRINALTVDCDDIIRIPQIKSAEVTEAQGFDQLPQIHIQWSKCSDADGYRLYRSADNKEYALIYTADRTVREYTDTLADRTAAQYYYKVEALYGDTAETSQTVSKSVKGVIRAPALTLSDYDGYKAVLTWNAVSQAERYELWKCADGESADSKEEHIADFAAGDAYICPIWTYTIDTDGWPLGTYAYKVRAVYRGEYTDWGTVRINRNLVWKQNSYDRARFEWLPVQNAVSYKLFHKVNGKTFSATVQNTSALMSMKSTSYLPCDEHQYYVNAYDASNNVLETSSTIVFRMTPDAVSIDSLEYDYANTVTITWSGGFGAENMAVYRSESPSEQGVLIAEPKAAEFMFADAVHKGKEYWYTLVPNVTATDGETVTGMPVQSDKIITFPEAVTLETAQYNGEDGISLVWKPARGAEGYLIERSDNQKDFAAAGTIAGGKNTAYTDRSVKAGNRYRYRVKSYYTAEDASQSFAAAQNSLEASILPKPVSISKIAELKRESSDNGQDRARVALSWNAVEGAQSYAVYRSVLSDGKEEQYVCIAQTVTDTQYIDTGALSDTSYDYKVTVEMNGIVSGLVNTAAALITTKPVLTALTMSEETVEIARNAEYALAITAVPAHYPYRQELVWSAADENATALEVIQKNDTLVINGTDGKEALHLSDNKIHAAGDSQTVRITLTAAIDGLSVSCDIFVYSDNFWVNGVKDLTYTGAALTQELAVYDGKRLLAEGTDYTVSYKNNVKVSTDETNPAKKPAVIVKGKGSYSGTQTVYFEILPEPASDAGKRSILKTKVKNIGTIAYEGAALEPKPVITDGRKTLTEGVDYTLSYQNNDGAGKAEVLITGINAYKGTRKVSFAITCNLSKIQPELVRVTFDTPEVPYTKGGAKPRPKVYCGGRLLMEGTDYKLSYKNNKAIASASDKKAPMVIVTGKGSYKGKCSAAFAIVKQNIGNLTLTAKDKRCTDKAGKFTTSFVITDTDGKKLSAGKDYDKNSVQYTYAETGKPVGKTDIVPEGTTLRITVNAAQTGSYTGSISGEYRITAYDIAKAKVTVTAQTYTGSEIEPNSQTGVRVMFKGYENELTEGTDYEITGYDNHIRTGTAKLYIKGIGDFGGTKTVKFQIKSKAFKWWWQD